MRMIAKFLAVSLAMTALAQGQAAQAPASDSTASSSRALKESDLFPDTVVAKGKGVEIKRSQLDAEVSRFKSQAAARGQALPDANTSLLERYILNQLLQVQLLEAKATEADKAAGRKQAEKRFADLKANLGDAEVNRQLRLLGATHDDLIAKWAELVTADAVAKRELKVNVTDAQVKQYFEDNQAKFEQPEMVVASHILLATQDPKTHEELSAEQKAAKHQQAEELLKRARAGEDFAKLAQQYSEDFGSKTNGGQYQFARGQMVKEFENAAFALKPNEISDVVTTEYGYHIIKLKEKIPARKAGLDDEVLVSSHGYVVLKDCWRDAAAATNAIKVSALIRQNLEAQQFQKELPAYIERLKKEANVQILDASLKTEDTAGALPPGHPALDSTAKGQSK